MDTRYSFTISESYTPKTIPMERLAEYLLSFARLLGEGSSVHFDRVQESSVALFADVDAPAQPKVRDRIQALHTGSAPADAVKAYHQLDEMLRCDNAVGMLSHDGVVIPFPGKRRPAPVMFGPFKQDGTLDGQVYRIGGKDDTKHVHIRNGGREYSTLVADEALALRLRHHLFGETLRFSGTGTWMRHGDGTWDLKKFDITHFEPLDDAPIEDVLGRIRAIRADRLTQLNDPVAQLLADRGADEDAT